MIPIGTSPISFIHKHLHAMNIIFPCSPASRKAWALLIGSTAPLIAATLLTSGRLAHQAFLLGIGWWCWTFFEYYLHRFIMHDRKGRTDPHRHAEHHRHHREPGQLRVKGWHRAVFLTSGPLMLWATWHCNSWLTAVVGFHFGLMGYAVTHWFLHRHLAEILLPRLSRHHFQHHCGHPDRCFGITITWWDVLLGTGQRPFPSKPIKVREFYYGRLIK